jgi:hypothetical protein
MKEAGFRCKQIDIRSCMMSSTRKKELTVNYIPVTMHGEIATNNREYSVPSTEYEYIRTNKTINYNAVNNKCNYANKHNVKILRDRHLLGSSIRIGEHNFKCMV